MITKEMAMNAYHRQVFYSATDRYKTGQRYQCRVNGKCKTWKTRPNDFSLPIKIGFRGHGYITHRNNCSWLFEDDILDTNKENSNEETS